MSKVYLKFIAGAQRQRWAPVTNDCEWVVILTDLKNMADCHG
jgi:hypothetical protein